MMPFVFLVLLSSFLILPFHSFGQQCFQPQHDSLLRLKNGFSTIRVGRGTPLALSLLSDLIPETRCTLSSWVPSTDCCRWEGITCDASSGYVVSLDLAGCGFGPPVIFEALFNLTTLRALDLSGNNFNSSLLPTTRFQLLKDLTHLNLSYSGFGGQVPLGIGRLEKLVSLDLSHNRQLLLFIRDNSYIEFPNHIPDLRTLVRNLRNLEVLYLDGTNISDKAWSRALAELPATKLQRLGLANCDLSGPIPASLSKFPLLQELWLSGNRLSSQVPKFLGNLTSLVSLDISGNNLVGPLPELIFNKLSSLVVFDASRNPQLYGPILESIGNLTSLRTLRISGCSFSGQIPVSINNITQLTELTIGGNKFTGPIPMLLGSSSSLQSLDISDNHFVGTIPWSIFTTFTRLALFDASSNQGIHGPIPESIGNCTSLRSLQLLGCGLSAGKIPITVNNLTQLQMVELSLNNFTGPLPSFESSTNSILTIGLANNHFTGSIPNTYNAFRELISIDISGNALTGPLPTLESSARTIRSIFLNDNQFTGSIPPTYGRSQNILEIDIGGNLINGPLPMSLLAPPSLISRIDVSRNNLTWILDMAPLPNITDTLFALDFSYNKITWVDSNRSHCPFPKGMETLKLASCNIAVFPAFLRDCHVSYRLDLSGNQMVGLIPNWIWDVVAGGQFNLSNNMLTGYQMPLHKEQPFSLATLDLHNNKLNAPIPLLGINNLVDYSNNNFTSSIPSNISSYLSNTTFQYLQVSKNNLIGNLPTSICNLASLQILDVSNNNLSGQIPSCISQMGRLQILDVSNNNLSGQIPSCISQMGQLQILNLKRNMFHDAIPPTMFSARCSLQTLDLNSNMLEGPFLWHLSNCNGLEVLNIGNNLFSGTFLKMSNLTNLRVLILRGNKFKGTLESLDVQSKVLQVLDISSNDFSGTLQPSVFLNLTAMMQDTSDNKGGKLEYLDFGYYQQSFVITCKGTELNFERILMQFTVIDLSNNKFQGKIPDVIGNLTSLHLFNLSHNKLSGSIPVSFGRLVALESLDLSWNNLSGKIPMQLASLHFLQYLNLSQNSLSGRVPFEGQLCTFSNSSYIGNDNLCGVPILKDCQASPSTFQKNDTKNNIYEGWLECNMLYVCFAFGFCSGLAIVVAARIICNYGRR